jgi:octaprenyl-diphosphate synthase
MHSAFLSAVEAELSRALDAAEPATLHEAARHLCLSEGAKRARPQLVERLGLALAIDDERLVRVAVAAELIHNASLLHDDVIDDGGTRRGRPSANAVYGNQVAVLAGDLLITLALERLEDCPPAITRAAVATIASMTRAAMREVEARGDASVSPERWQGIAAGKTGALLGFCGAATAALADDGGRGEPELGARLERAGVHLGVAFQGADDLADALPGTGKPRFADLTQKNASLLLACASRDGELREGLATLWRAEPTPHPDDVESFAARVRRSSAPDDTRAFIAGEVGAAVDALGSLATREDAAPVLAWARALLDDDFFTSTLPDAKRGAA